MNKIATQTTMATVLDEKLAATSKTAEWEKNATGIKYNGGNKFQLAKMAFSDVDNLDYDRAKGFTDGGVTVEYELKEFKKDYGKRFTLDAMDVDETNYIATMQKVMAEYVRTVETPAVDRFRFAEVLKLAKANTDKGAHAETYTIAANGALAQLRKSMSEAMTGTGLTNEDLRIYASRTFYNALVGDKDVQKVINLSGSSVALGGAVKTIDDTPLEVIDDDTIGCLYMVMYYKAPIAIVKHRVSKIFTPDQNPDADAFVGTERCYHTLEIADNSYPAIVVVEAAA